MEEILRESRKEFFWKLSTKFAKSLHDTFPQCAESSDLYLYMQNIVKDNQTLEEENIHTWHEKMMQPLVKVKYAKAIERITGKPANVYQACMYKDASAIQKSCASERLGKLKIEEKLSDERFQEQDKEAFWSCLQEMNRLSFEYVGAELPVVPTRDEIQQNIRQRQPSESTSANRSMLKGFTTALSAFNASNNQEPLYNYDDDDRMRSEMQRWIDVSTVVVNGETVATLCNQRNDAIANTLQSKFPEFKWENDLTSSQWKLLDKIFSFCTVGDKIPLEMMEKIEGMASVLAQDIVQGKRDLSDLNLEDIGKQVLSQVPTKDIDKFAGNIDQILPAITRLNKPT